MRNCKHLKLIKGEYVCTLKNDTIGAFDETQFAICRQCKEHTERCIYCGSLINGNATTSTICSTCYQKRKLIREIQARLRPYSTNRGNTNAHDTYHKDGQKR